MKPYPPALKSIAIIPFLFALAFITPFSAAAQAPTSLSYPTPTVAVANVSHIYLSPNVSGIVAGYAITPALPAGLSFNTNTGVIMGTPTAASAVTSYTVTATGNGTSGSTSTTLSLTVTNNFFNNAYQPLHFGGPGVTITNEVGDGTHVGDVVLYQTVATLSGQAIDAIVTTTGLTNVVDGYMVYDQTADSGLGYTNNNEAFFSPQFYFSAAGSARFGFQFILGGSYEPVKHTGLNVTLQNVQINTYDIDADGSAGTNQYNEFGGFSSSELGANTTLTPWLDTASQLTRFHSNIDSNSVNAIADATRVRVTYNNISNFNILVGADAASIAYFFVDFSAGPAFTTAVQTTAPSVDLDTTLPGVYGLGAGCGTQLLFTPAGQTNITAQDSALNSLDVSFTNTAASIPDGSNEQLLLAGTGSSFPLVFTNGASSAVTLGGNTYTATQIVADTTSTLRFTGSNGSGLSLSQAESLLDALRYNNASASATYGDRAFTVTVSNYLYRSPAAIYTATVNCVSISGHIYRDANGLTDSLVNASGTAPQLVAGAAWAILTNPLTHVVYQSQPVADGGGYSFGTVSAGRYIVIVSATSRTPGSSYQLPAYPAGYASTGEQLGAGIGNDLLSDGQLIVTVGTQPVTEANFGIDALPAATTAGYTINTPQPHSTETLTPANGLAALAGTDPEDGSVGSGANIVISSLDSMNGNTLLYNGMVVAAGDTLRNYDPNQLAIRYDGITSNKASFTFRITDAAILYSPQAATYTINFTTPLPVQLVSFTATAAGKAVQTAWQVAAENGIQQYTTERSANGRDWTVVASQPATGQTSYTAQDAQPLTGTSYYRLAIQDKASGTSYSPVRTVTIGAPVTTALTAWPNPVSDKLNIQASLPDGTALLLVDANGRIVIQVACTNNAAILNTAGLMPGTYFLTAQNGDAAVQALRIQKK